MHEAQQTSVVKVELQYCGKRVGIGGGSSLGHERKRGGCSQQLTEFATSLPYLRDFWIGATFAK